MNEKTEEYNKGYSKGYSTAKNKYLKQIKELKKEYETQIHDVCSVYPFNLMQDVIEERETEFHFSVKQIEKGMQERLTERENHVLQMRYARNMTLEDVGKEIGVTRERVRQIEARAIRKLRHPRVLNDMSVTPYNEYISVKKELENTQMQLEIANKKLIAKGENEANPEEVVDFFDKDIDDLNLSVRAHNCLARAGLRKISDVHDYWLKNKTFAYIRSMGKRSSEEVIDLFKQNGIDLE